MNNDQLMMEVRIRFYQLFLHELRTRNQNQLCPPDVFVYLNDLIENLMDYPHREVSILVSIQSLMDDLGKIEYLNQYVNKFFIGGIAKYLMGSYISKIYLSLKMMIDCMHATLSNEQNFPFEHSYVQKVFVEIDNNIRNCESFLFSFMDTYPQQAKSIQEYQVSKQLIAF